MRGESELSNITIRKLQESIEYFSFWKGKSGKKKVLRNFLPFTNKTFLQFKVITYIKVFTFSSSTMQLRSMVQLLKAVTLHLDNIFIIGGFQLQRKWAAPL